MCAACDPNAQDRLDFVTGKISLDKKTCNLVKLKCKKAIVTNINFVFPYLKVVEPLSRCTQTGLMTQRQRYLINEMNPHIYIHFIREDANLKYNDFKIQWDNPKP